MKDPDTDLYYDERDVEESRNAYESGFITDDDEDGSDEDDYATA